MHNLANKAYGMAAQRTATDKQNEYTLFRQITAALEIAANAGKSAPVEWADAIYRNQQLWTTLAVDLLNPGNSLPQDLKGRLLYLSEFVRQTSHRVLAGSDGMADLIDINKTIMIGLAGRQTELSEEAA